MGHRDELAVNLGNLILLFSPLMWLLHLPHLIFPISSLAIEDVHVVHKHVEKSDRALDLGNYSHIYFLLRVLELC